MAVVTRKATWSAEAPEDGWSEDLIWYAAAIHQMKLLSPGLDEFRPMALRVNELRGIRFPTDADRQEFAQLMGQIGAIIPTWSDPRSLGYQAQVHDTFLRPNLWPQHNGQPVLWHECAHANWFFLPWHRAYLLEFEAVVRSHIEDLGGPHETWALPYWNHSDYVLVPEAATLPLALRGPELPDGLEIPGLEADPGGEPLVNPLYEPSRIGPAPLTTPPSADDWSDASAALTRHHYATAEDANLVSFAGGYPEDLTRFHFAGELGQIDSQPHGTGHVETGGLMGAFSTAGLDPAFWMHHANVDRLWETYAHDLGHGYPFPDGRPAGGIARQAFDAWSTREFRFLRPDGEVATWTAPQVLDTTALGYEYDTTEAPQLNEVIFEPGGQDVDPFGLAPEGFTPVAAASDVGLDTATTIPLTGGGEEDGSDFVTPAARWTLRFDGLRCTAPAVTSYAVYLGEVADQPDPDRLVGVLSLFGVFEASIEANGNLGRSRLLDATGVVRAVPDFDPFAATLTLVPTSPGRDLGSVGLTVERISLEVG